jgi:AraC family transcriptional regulator
MVGETPVELLRRLRLERAAWQLGHTDRAVTEIAFDAGYETHEAFTRAFRANYNASPSGFRPPEIPACRVARGVRCPFRSRRAGAVIYSTRLRRSNHAG